MSSSHHPRVSPGAIESSQEASSLTSTEPSGSGIGYLVRHAHKAFARVLADRLAPHGVSPGQWTVLRALWQEDCPSQVELAVRIRVEKASLTGVLSSLERQGLIVRKRSETDRRRWHVHLTDHGRDLERQLLPFASQVDLVATQGFSSQEIESFKALLTRALKNLQ